tara:strand:- start:704 stop:853 length:150 start_codon:yes stop_codon:yes gene_type:complete
MDELTLEQQAKRMNLIKKAQRKIDRKKSAQFTERRRAFEFNQDLKRLGA